MPELYPAPADTRAPLSRRGFFQRAGAGAAAFALVASGCDSDDGVDPMEDPVVLDFSDDFGVLNYAYALEQLEYAFYEAVLAGGYYQGLSSSSEERQILADLRDHELAHVDFFAAAIPGLGGTLIPDLSVDFSAIDFDDRASVLGAAQTFEDVGVSAYNGAGRYLRDADLLTIAGKIVSVEARHASAIRDIFQSSPRAFAGDDVVDPVTGLDVLRTPSQVLSPDVAGGFITTAIDLQNVPSS